eukprot:m.101407 g.101407  ORF g.101407 m.101407 type:complete len:1126 (+) comp15166_c0_seq1:70-3447(+)
MKLSDLRREPGEKYLGLFKAVYLGAVPIDIKHAEDVTDVHVSKCFVEAKVLNQIPHKVWIAITSMKVATLGRKAHNLMQASAMDEITYCGLLAEDPRRFAFVTLNPAVNVILCNMFTIKEESAGVPVCLANAFQAYIEDQAQEVQAERDAAARAKQAARRDEEHRLQLEAQSAQPPAKPTPSRTASAPATATVAAKSNSTAISPSRSVSTGGKGKDKGKKRRSTDGKRGLFRRKTSSSSSTGPVVENDTDSKPMGTFLTKYFGEVGVDNATGGDEVQKALAKLHAQHDERNMEAGRRRKKHRKMVGEPAVLIVTSEGLKVMERTSETLLCNIFIKDVTFTTAGTLDKRRDFFAFIAVDVRVDRRACYLFELLKGKGEAVCKTVARAFDTYAKAYKSGEEAFLPTTAKGQAPVDVPPELDALQIDRDRLNALKVLGAGMYGKVFLADETQADGSVIQRAVKLLRKSSKVDHTAAFLMEAQTMAELRHPNLVNIVGVAVERKPWLCVLEFMQYGDLANVLQTFKERNLTLFGSEYLNICMQACEGMEFITSQGFVHMDLAARNCLLHENTLVKIADFGLTRKLDEGKDYWLMRKTQRLAVKWIPPDALSTKRFGQATDIWAMGVFMWELFAMGGTPYSEFPVPEVPGRVAKGYRLSRPESCPEQVYELMTQTWAKEPAHRPTFTRLKSELFTVSESLPKMPPRDVGALLNAKLTKDIRRLSMKVQRQSIRRRKSTSAKSLTPPSADPDIDPNEPEEDLRRRSFVADSNARLKLKASIRRSKQGSTRAAEGAGVDSGVEPAIVGAEATIEGVLVLAEEAIDDDEIDVSDESDVNVDAISPSGSVFSEPGSPDSNQGSVSTTPSRRSICVAIEEDEASAQTDCAAGVTEPSEASTPAVTEEAADNNDASEATMAVAASNSASHKSVDQRLRVNQAPVELTEEETQRFIELGLMADPKVEAQAKVMEKSRIYSALNPTLLYAEQAAGSEKDVRGIRARNYAETQQALGPDGQEDLEDDAWDELDQEFEDDDDCLDIDDIPDFGDFEEVLSANRSERERLADERRRQLRELYLAQASEQLKRQEYILVKIKTRKEEEAAVKEAEKEAVVASTLHSLADMTFNFSFNESTEA